MAVKNVKQRALTGRCAVWDGTNPDDFRELLGDRFLGVWESMAMVRRRDGTVTYLSQGWSACLYDGGIITINGAQATRDLIEILG